MPTYEFYEHYEVFALKTKMRKKDHPHFCFRRAGADDTERIIHFLKEEGRNFQFFPILSPVDLQEGFPNLNAENFYMVCDKENQILALGAAWDQKTYKPLIIHWLNNPQWQPPLIHRQLKTQ